MDLVEENNILKETCKQNSILLSQYQKEISDLRASKCLVDEMKVKTNTIVDLKMKIYRLEEEVKFEKGNNNGLRSWYQAAIEELKTIIKRHLDEIDELKKENKKLKEECNNGIENNREKSKIIMDLKAKVIQSHHDFNIESVETLTYKLEKSRKLNEYLMNELSKKTNTN